MSCFICQNNELQKFLSLGHQPPSDAFLKAEDLNNEENTYPLNLCYCPECGLVQLDYTVDPAKLFVDYVYNSGTNNSLIVNFKNLVDKTVDELKLKKNDLAIDIGSNDGTLLLNYLPYGIKILGVDPSSVSAAADQNGIPTVVDFFSQAVAQKIAAEHGQAKVITATNVFAHVNDLTDFMAGIVDLIGDKGVFISESGYLLDFIDDLQYDATYHEHLRYYSLKPLKILFDKFGMEVFRVERITTHGGSIRVFASRQGDFPIEENVSALEKLENEKKLYDQETYKKFAEKVEKNKLEILKLMIDLKSQNKTVAGLGAPAKGNTLLNYCKLDSYFIDYLAEKSQLKIGMFSPGMHIPVVDEERIYREQPDYLILFSWNIADELINKLKELGFKGKFIFLKPAIKIV